MFESQTQTEYCVQRGSYQNQECANGLINGREKWENKIPSGAKHTSAKEEVKAESGLKQWKLNATPLVPPSWGALQPCEQDSCQRRKEKSLKSQYQNTVHIVAMM